MIGSEKIHSRSPVRKNEQKIIRDEENNTVYIPVKEPAGLWTAEEGQNEFIKRNRNSRGVPSTVVAGTESDDDDLDYFLEPVSGHSDRLLLNNDNASRPGRGDTSRQGASDSDNMPFCDPANLEETTTRFDRGMVVAGFGCLKLLGQKNRVMRKLKTFNPPVPPGYKFQPIEYKIGLEDEYRWRPWSRSPPPPEHQQVVLTCYRDPNCRHVLPVEATSQNPFEIRGFLIHPKNSNSVISCITVTWVEKENLWNRIRMPAKQPEKNKNKNKKSDEVDQMKSFSSNFFFESRVRPSSVVEDSTTVSSRARSSPDSSSKRGRISSTTVSNVPKRAFVIFSHGNSTDLGHSCAHLIRFAKILRVNLLAYDYPGYGLSSGKPSESSMNASLRTVYEYVTTSLGIPSRLVIIYGQSIGSAPSCSLASNPSDYPIGALVLHSPISSGMRLMLSRPGRTRFVDVFENADRMPSIPWPILVIHGKEDTEVPLWHSALLVKNARSYSSATRICKEIFLQNDRAKDYSLQNDREGDEDTQDSILPRLSGKQRASSWSSSTSRIKLTSRLSAGTSRLCSSGIQRHETRNDEGKVERNYRKRVRFWAADGCGHNDIDIVRDELYFEKIREFIQTAVLSN